MKKIVVLLASVLMAFSMAGCSVSIKNGDSSSESSEESTTQATEESTEEATSEEVTEDTTEASEETTEQDTTDAGESESETSAQGNSGSADVSDAIQDTDTSDENAADINQWVKTTLYSATDDTYHSVYVRVTKVTTSTDDQKYVDDAIALNNSLSSDYGQIDVAELKVPSDAELCVLDYEVYVPEDFPTEDWGIIAPDITFGAVSIGGGGIPTADGSSTYIGMGSTMNMEIEEERDYTVGNTYAFRSLYMMVKGYKDYVFHYGSYVEGTTEITSDASTDGYHKAS